jgi:hypothetical protein
VRDFDVCSPSSTLWRGVCPPPAWICRRRITVSPRPHRFRSKSYSWTKIDPRFERPAPNWPGVSEVPNAQAGDSNVCGDLRVFVAEAVAPLAVRESASGGLVR